MKKGISLMVLVITIVILLILLSVTTMTVGNAIQNSRKSAFASDLVSLEDAVDIYYMQNGEFPVLSENNEYIEYVYNNNILIAKDDENNTISLNEQYSESFKQELILNSDMTDGEDVVSNTVFYKIDLKKIDVKKTKRGTTSNGVDDIYVMAYPSQTVYYLKGLKVGENVYFSLINLTEYQQLSNQDDLASDVTEITYESEGMLVKVPKKAWTNIFDITIDTYINSNEKLYASIPNLGIDLEIPTTEGHNIINIADFDIGSLLTTELLNLFYSLNDSDKYMIIEKRVDEQVVANIKISIANYEIESPEVPFKEDGKTLDFSITSSESENLVVFKPNDNVSGIKEVRYVYLTEFDENALPKYIYNDENGNAITEFTSEYMLSNGKKAYVANDGSVEIKLPKDIEAIYIAIYDKAGNVVLVTKNVTPDVYLGINLKNITSSLVFGYTVKTSEDITKAITSISTDGINFTNEQNLTLVKNDNEIYIASASFENNNFKEVYVKFTIENDTITEVRIKKVDISEKAYEIINSVVTGIIYSENKTYIDDNGDTAVLPAGFKVSSKSNEQTIDDGLVIIDKKGNEFVWIPCTMDGENNSVKYEKRNGDVSSENSVTAEQTSDDTLPTDISSEIDQINKYSGFYVARYEASLPDDQTTEELMATKIFSSDDNNKTDIGKAQSKPDKIVWNNISYDNAKIVSENVISNEYVQSGLITGTQWDTMLEFIEQTGVNIASDSTEWGNYYNKYGYTINGYYREQHADVVYTKGEYTKSASGFLLLTTGKFGSVVEEGSPKNIHDVAGNVWEWTAENVAEQGGANTSVGNKVLRGGGFGINGNVYPVSYRHGIRASTFLTRTVGFRFVLYVK